MFVHFFDTKKNIDTVISKTCTCKLVNSLENYNSFSKNKNLVRKVGIE